MDRIVVNPNPYSHKDEGITASLLPKTGCVVERIPHPEFIP
jgi:hypothetical protein